MLTLDDAFPEIVAALTERYGQPAPLAEDLEPFEAIVAVIVARTGGPRKVRQALQGLREDGLLEPRALAEAEAVEVADTLRGAGISSPAKVAGPLRRLARWLVERHGGSVESLGAAGTSTSTLRDELASLHGIGLATADAILLFALRRPAYPVDRATYRILVRHGWIDPDAGYEEARSLLERQGPDDPDGLARVSAWLERIGVEYCKASVPKCEPCPLRPLLPSGGPLEPDR